MKIKNKFSLAFAPILTAALVVYTFIALSLFTSDKVAYVFSSNQDGSHMASVLTENLFQAQMPLIETIKTSFNYKDGKFEDQAKSYLQLSDTVKTIIMYGRNEKAWVPLDYIGEKVSENERGGDLKSSFRDQSPIDFVGDMWIIQKKLTVKSPPYDSFLIRLIMRSNPIKSMIDTPRFYQLTLVDFNGNIILKPKDSTDQRIKNLLKNFLNESLPRKEISYSAEKEAYIFTWSPVPNTDFGFVTAIEKSKAMQALSEMKRKSIGVLFLLVSIGLITVLKVVSGLTKNIELLSKSLISFSAGNLNEKSNIQADDEVGTLSKNFNAMTDKIKNLIQQTETKARMESELNTARHVQSLFLPHQDLVEEEVSILGFIESASECGGDWWSYHKTDRGYRFLIADVTGHGVAPAILTAALHAGCEALREFKNLALNEFVARLNEVIYNCSKGELQLSLFAGELHLSDAKLVYVNASHCSPFIISKNKEINVLDEVSGPHLGRSSKSSYGMESVDFSSGDTIFLYTDGLTEFTNKQNRAYGEKRLFKLFKKHREDIVDQKTSVRELVREDFFSFRESNELSDDVTFITISRLASVQDNRVANLAV